ncbi:MAG: amylo-alpha-1,6-glucosidase [Roseiflexaceae bacterium]
MPIQHFYLHDIHWQAERPGNTPIFLSSRHGYMVAGIDGQIHPYGDAHLIGRMGGLWLHPVRVMHGWQLYCGKQPLIAMMCHVHPDAVERVYQVDAAVITTHEQMAVDGPGLDLTVTVTGAPLSHPLTLTVALDVHGCWFGGVADMGATVRIEDTTVVVVPNNIAVGATITLTASGEWEWHSDGRNVQLVGSGQIGTYRCQVRLQHQRATSVESVLLEAVSQPILQTPDPKLNAYWLIARHNMQQLMADYPDIRPYFLAGIPEYPQLFGCDTTYSIPGLMGAGYHAMSRSALLALAEYAQRACGRVPHEITTNGRVFHPGNAQETPQFAVACADYLAWSGDIETIRQLYPLCVEGMAHFEGVLKGHHWPYGDGMVERHGMGPFKLDSVAYLYHALQALMIMADALGDDGARIHWRDAAVQLATRFEQAWWMEDEGLYADSLQRDGTPQLDGHWTAVVPGHTGLAEPNRRQRVYQRMTREFVNQWGLVHTRGREELVWTLPTGLLALEAFAQSDVETGLQLLRNIGVTSEHGSLGLLKELIPQGICFVQLWSTGLFAQGITQGLFGLAPDATKRHLALDPQLPADWPEMALRDIACGDAHFAVTVTQRSVTVEYLAGSMPWLISVAKSGQQQIVPGQSWVAHL